MNSLITEALLIAATLLHGFLAGGNVERALVHMPAWRKLGPHVVSWRNCEMSVDLEDGRTITVPVGWYPRLAYGTSNERANFQIGGAGYGIHWPDLDEDIGVEGLLLGKKSSETHESFRRWLQRRNIAE